eukprot:6214768-Pleurochrysis_carterae.AAC.7
MADLPYRHRASDAVTPADSQNSIITSTIGDADTALLGRSDWPYMGARYGRSNRNGGGAL